LKVVAKAFVAKGADGYDWIMLAPKASIVLFMPPGRYPKYLSTDW